MTINVKSDPIFAGFAGARLGVEAFELGHGLILSQTYAHLMSPFLMAFSRPEKKGRHHPAPWSPVKGGFGLDICVQLHIPASFSMADWFDRLNTIWWIAALMRLKLGPGLSIPVVTNRPFADIPMAAENAEILPIEINPRRMILIENQNHRFEIDDLVWVRDHWLSGGKLVRQHNVLNTAIQAFDSSSTASSPSLALVMLWGALEQIFSPSSNQELSFRVSAAIASFLEPQGKKRLELQKSIAKLYKARSQAAHGATGEHTKPLLETFAITRRILFKIIEKNQFPNRDDIDLLIFGAGDAEAN